MQRNSEPCCGEYGLGRKDEKMYGDKRKIKYYKIRVSAFWVGVAGLVTLATFATGYRKNQCDKKKMTQRQEWINITYDGLVT